jgi:hypothetical protein
VRRLHSRTTAQAGGVRGVVQDPGQEDVLGLARPRGEHGGDDDADEAVDHELHRLPLRDAHDQQHHGQADADRQGQPEVVCGDVGCGEADRGQRPLDHAATSAERLGEPGADDVLDGAGVDARQLGLAGRRVAAALVPRHPGADDLVRLAH